MCQSGGYPQSMLCVLVRREYSSLLHGQCAPKLLSILKQYNHRYPIFYSLGILISVIIGIALPDEEAQSFVAEFADLGNNTGVQWIIEIAELPGWCYPLQNCHPPLASTETGLYPEMIDH
jgi:hypothetical protein